MANVVVDNTAPDGNGITHVRQLRGDGTTVIEAPDGTLTAAAGLTQYHDRWLSSDDQTVFQLTAIPRGSGILLFVNGMLQDVSDYSLLADTLTWLRQGFTLRVGDSLDAIYAA